MTTHRMATHPIRHNRTLHEGLHPRVYQAVAGLTLWYVLSAWALFSGGAYDGLTFAVVTVFFLIAVGLPAVLFATWWRHTATAEHGRRDSFRDWAAHDFATWTGSVNATEAAMQVLLPIAAVAIGITIFGLIFVLAVPSVA